MLKKISNVLSTSRQYFAKKCVFSWRLKMLRLSAGSRRLSGSEFQVDGPATAKTPTTKTVQTIARNDQLPLTGRPYPACPGRVGSWDSCRSEEFFGGGMRYHFIQTRQQTCVEKHLTAANCLYISSFRGVRPGPASPDLRPWTPLGDAPRSRAHPWFRNLATPLIKNPLKILDPDPDRHQKANRLFLEPRPTPVKEINQFF